MSITLRQRMHQDLQLAGLAEGTQKAYLRAVRQLAAHFRKPPTRSPNTRCGSTWSISRMSARILPAP
jgi:hypothetical protein